MNSTPSPLSSMNSIPEECILIREVRRSRSRRSPFVFSTRPFVLLFYFIVCHSVSVVSVRPLQPPKALVCCRRIISSLVKTSPLPFSSVYLFNDSIVSAFPSVMSVTFFCLPFLPSTHSGLCQQPTTPILQTRVLSRSYRCLSRNILTSLFVTRFLL
jgi:hypothetical protein